MGCHPCDDKNIWYCTGLGGKPVAMAPSPVALMSFGCSSLSASSLIQSGSPRTFRVPSISITSGAANPRFPMLPSDICSTPKHVQHRGSHARSHFCSSLLTTYLPWIRYHLYLHVQSKLREVHRVISGHQGLIRCLTGCIRVSTVVQA